MLTPSDRNLFLLRTIVFPPVMHIFVPQDLTNLPVAQRRLPFTHLPCDWRIQTRLLQELGHRYDCVICGIEDSES